MRDARRFFNDITIGAVPDTDDIYQLKDLGYKTLVDLRDPEERFSGLVQKRAEEKMLKYVELPVRREAIIINDLKKFYSVVFEKNDAPFYAFSRHGRKPLTFLLIFEIAASNQWPGEIFRRMRELGLSSYVDEALQTFIIDFINSEGIQEIAKMANRLWPQVVKEIRENKGYRETTGVPPWLQDPIRELLVEASKNWMVHGDVTSLREVIQRLSETLNLASTEVQPKTIDRSYRLEDFINLAKRGEGVLASVETKKMDIIQKVHPEYDEEGRGEVDAYILCGDYTFEVDGKTEKVSKVYMYGMKNNPLSIITLEREIANQRLKLDQQRLRNAGIEVCEQRF